jgi:peptidoglycan/LPS O-acetylase OafA/YrhL
MGFASAVLIQWLACRPVAWLRHRALIAVGDWSYSIYLIHLPIAFAVARLMAHSGLILADRDWAAVIVALATAAITIPASAAIYNFVERPGIALGNRLIRQWSIGRDPAPSPADQPDPAGDERGRATTR